MRLSLDTALVVLALAQGLVAAPANADVPEQPPLKRAANGFHKSALRHSAGLARDLRIALRGLSRVDYSRASLARRDGNGNKPFCVSNPSGSGSPQQGNNITTNNSPGSHSSQGSPSNTKKGSPSSTGSPAANPTSTAQSNFKLVQSYVRVYTALLCRAAKIFTMLTISGRCSI